jgi:hypothetical protein
MHSGGSGIVYYTCGEPGHTSPLCSKNTSQSGDGKAEMDLKSSWKPRKRLVCFNCGKKGHLSHECRSPGQTAAGKEALRQHHEQKEIKGEIKCSSSSDFKKPALKHQLDTTEPSEPWTSTPIYTFTTIPKSSYKLNPPALLIPSNLMWDKVAKQYVDTSLHYYYETCQPSTSRTAFNNISKLSKPAASANAPSTALELMKAIVSSIPNPNISSNVIARNASGPMRTILRTEDNRPILTVIDSGTHIAVVPQSVIHGCGMKIN